MEWQPMQKDNNIANPLDNSKSGTGDKDVINLAHQQYNQPSTQKKQDIQQDIQQQPPQQPNKPQIPPNQPQLPQKDLQQNIGQQPQQQDSQQQQPQQQSNGQSAAKDTNDPQNQKFEDSKEPQLYEQHEILNQPPSQQPQQQPQQQKYEQEPQQQHPQQQQSKQQQQPQQQQQQQQPQQPQPKQQQQQQQQQQPKQQQQKYKQQEPHQDLKQNPHHLKLPGRLGQYCVREGPNLLRIKKGFVPNMKTEGLIYVNDNLLKHLVDEYNVSQAGKRGAMPSIIQTANVTCLPGIVGCSLAMPDIHSGYGFPIGGVMAVDTANPMSVISPGGVGFDINCGVRLLRSDMTVDEVMPRLEQLCDAMYKKVPSGVGVGGTFHLTKQTMDQLLNQGMKYLLDSKMCWPEDLEHCEEGGCMQGADASKVSARAKKRGFKQCGTLGSGNHYAEVQVVDEIKDKEAAEAFGLKKGQVCVMVHSGSRGLGHQVCTDFLQTMERIMSKQGIKINDRQLAACKINSQEGKNYLAAMAAACNFAFCNRSVMAHNVREAFEETFNRSARDLGLYMVYDVCHNTAKFEKHFTCDGKEMDLLVHRKGATRAFGPNHPSIPKDYQKVGQPVLIGGTMGTNSYVLVGTDTAMRDTFGSTCHGAGRFMSRTKAKNTITQGQVFRQMKEHKVVLRVVKRPLVAEEAPDAYKDVNEVVSVCHDAGISKIVARLSPLGVVKG